MAGGARPLQVIRPQWPAPARVRALATTRIGGISAGAWAGLNLGAQVGDDPAAVAANRRLLVRELGLPAQPRWLRQVHGTRIVAATDSAPEPEADGMIAAGPGAVCAVLTADCLPVLLCDTAGAHVAAVHAGWRGLCAGVLEAAVDALEAAGAGPLLGWLGPGISAPAYEVDEVVRAAFLDADPAAAPAFTASRPGHWHLNLGLIARQRLAAVGVARVSGGGHCTLREAEYFYSYRRDGACGRQATLIWIEGA